MGMKHVISVGGGLSSTVFLPMEVLKTVPAKDVVMVMAKLPNEDPDVWRLVKAAEDKFGIEVQMIGTNETPFDVFNRAAFLGNSRIDPCSDQLKREVMRNWVMKTYPLGTAILYTGIGAYEIDRQMKIVKRWKEAGYEMRMPLIDKPELTREYMMSQCLEMFEFIPRLYLMGFSHNNCGGACIKAGMKEWARLLYFLPDVYSWWAENERQWRLVHGNYTILKRQIKGETNYMTLDEFRFLTYSRWNCTPPVYPTIDGWEDVAKTTPDYDETAACSFCDAIA